MMGNSPVTVKKILEFLDTLAPQDMKMSWDNVGLLCGDPGQTVERVLIALDPFEDTVAEAIERDAQLILTHHPIIFQPRSSVTEGDSVGRALRTLIRNNIAAVNAHTNLDLAPDGVNQALASVLGLTDISVIDPVRTDPDGRQWGLLRKGHIEQQSLTTFLSHVKARLHTPCLRYADGSQRPEWIAVGGGACADEMYTAARAGCDTFVTSDVKYNQFWDAAAIGLTLIDAGHFYTENPVCRVLCDKLRTGFPELSIEISRNHTDCMKFF